MEIDVLELIKVSNKSANDKTKSSGTQKDDALGGKTHLSSSFEEAIYAAWQVNLNALLNSVLQYLERSILGICPLHERAYA